MARHISPAERETHITLCDTFKRATVYTEQRSVITKIRRLAKTYPDAVKIYRDGKHGGTAYVEADMPATFVGLRPAKFTTGAANGNPSPIHTGNEAEEPELF